MHIPPQLPTARPSDNPVVPTNSISRASAGTNEPIDTAKLTLDALTKLPVKQLVSALETTSITSPEALAKALSIKQPTLLEAIAAKAQVLTPQLQKSLPANLQQAVAQWLSLQASNATMSGKSTQSAIALLTLIIPNQAPVNAGKAAVNSSKLSLPVQLNALTPSNATPKPGTPVNITISSDGRLSLNQPAAQAAANRNSSGSAATTGHQAPQLSTSANTTPLKQPPLPSSLRSEAFTTLTSAPSAHSNLARPTSRSVLSAAINQLKSLVGPNPAAMQLGTKTAIEQLNVALTLATQLPPVKQLQALPKPLLNALEQALPKATTAPNSPSVSLPTLEPLLSQFTPKAQLQQLPAITAALTILGKLMPSNQMSDQTRNHHANAEIDAIHRLMKQDLTQLSQNITRSLLARATSQGNELINLQHEFALQTENGWLSANLHIEEKPRENNASKKQTSEKAPQWEVNLSLEVPMRMRSFLPMDVRVTWLNANIQITFWSTDKDTCKLLELRKPELISTLQDSGINVKDCFIEQGAAPKKHRAVTRQMTNIDIHT